jgi:hypothetical protein
LLNGLHLLADGSKFLFDRLHFLNRQQGVLDDVDFLNGGDLGGLHLDGGMWEWECVG